ncbi:MAG: hypothetical protein Q8O99_01635 [bacterium]|nr:hypothetical protein [bacterium]
MPKNKETIDDLKRMGKNDLYKFHGSFNSQQGFFKHIQSLPEMPD